MKPKREDVFVVGLLSSFILAGAMSGAFIVHIIFPASPFAEGPELAPNMAPVGMFAVILSVVIMLAFLSVWFRVKKE